MAKKKTKDKKAPAGGDAAAGAKNGKGGLIGQLVLMVALGGASFGTVLFLPSHAGPALESDASEHDADSAPPPLDLKHESTFVELSPFTISLDGGNSLLKIGITLEMSEDVKYDIDPNDPRLRDAFTGYLRALKPEQIRDVAYMARMRAQLLRRARLIFESDAIYSILITDFLVQ